MVRSSLLLIGILVTAFGVGCASAPPIPPEPPSWNNTSSSSGGPIAVAAAVDASTLRSTAEREREHINALLDVAERRELREGGPPILREMKDTARQLDKIEARINDIDRNVMGPDRDSELELVSDDLRRLQTRVSLLADTLR